MSSDPRSSTKSPMTQTGLKKAVKDDTLGGFARNRITQKVVPKSNADESAPIEERMFNEDAQQFYRRADEWDRKQKPDSDDLTGLAFTFVSFCRSQRALWFSDNPLDKSSWDHIDAALIEKWPRILGSITGEATNNNLWDFEDVDQKIEPPTQFTLSLGRYDYEERYEERYKGRVRCRELVSSRLKHFKSFERWSTLAIQRPKKPVPSGTLMYVPGFQIPVRSSTKVLQSPLNPDISYHCLTIKCIAFILLHLGATPRYHFSQLALLEYYLNPWGTEAKAWRSSPEE
ncbi:hypothetical protein VTL71DRAFT_6891 [Oculimacula yallundae]|uniref:Fungal-type protein kinase domain-containing protein n=1 Tax=Oculimacula yallundae TaxID=86028 RepID=A0ABR4BV45_9HELO